MSMVRFSARWVAVLLLVAVSAAIGPGRAGAEEVLVKAGKVYVAAGQVLEPGQVLIEDGKIKQVAESIDVGDDVRVVDLAGGVLLPGLVNAYSQLGVAGGDSEFTREITPGFDLRLALDFNSRSFREAAAAGTTTVGLFPGTENVIGGRVAIVKTRGPLTDRIVKPVAGVVVAMASDPARRNRARSRPDSIYIRQPTNRMGVAWLLRSSLARTAKQPDDPRVSDIAAVLRGERPLFGVSRTAHDIQALLRIGAEFRVSPIVVGGQEAHQVVEELAAAKVPVILGPLSARTTTGTEGTEVVWNRAGLLARGKIKFAITGTALLEQARFAVRYGLSPDQALTAITAVPAELLGVADRVGTLAEGKDADLVALSGEPFEFTTRVTATIVDGIIYQQGSQP